MALKIYISHTSGSMEIKRKQDFVYQLLNGRSITYELVDIADPQLGEEKQFMRDNAKPEDGQKVPMPPQIFSNNQYIGDYDAIHHANEVDEVYEFLGIHQPKTANSASVEINQDSNEEVSVNGSGEQ